MILCIDTSSEKHQLALYWPSKIKKRLVWQRKETSKELLLKIDQFLNKNKVKLKNLRAIGVFRGPGSFTGLRIGISVAQALSFALNIPVYGLKEKDIIKSAERAYKKLKRGNKGEAIKPIYTWS